MKERKNYVWDTGNIIYLYDTNFPTVRILHQKTSDCRDVTNQHLIKKVIKNGVERISLIEN